VLVGDSGQIQPIAAGGAFTAISEITNPVKITEIRRQSEEWQRQASLNFATGNIESALIAYEDQGYINAADSETSAVEALVKDYVADLKTDPNKQSSRLILTHRRKDVAKLNSAVRKSLIANGKLKGELKYETTNGAKKFAVGDRILFTKNDNNLGVKNGTVGKVLENDVHCIMVQPDDEKAMPIVVDLETYNSLDHGYAVTIHKSQGATVDKTWLLATKTINQNLLYVAATRHRTTLNAFVYIAASEKDTLKLSKMFEYDYFKPTTSDYEDSDNNSRDKLKLKKSILRSLN